MLSVCISMLTGSAANYNQLNGLAGHMTHSGAAGSAGSFVGGAWPASQWGGTSVDHQVATGHGVATAATALSRQQHRDNMADMYNLLDGDLGGMFN